MLVNEKKALSFPDSSLEKEITSVVDQFSTYINTLPSDMQALAASTSLWKERGVGLSHFLPFWLNQEFADGNLLNQAHQMAVANRFGQVFCLLRDAVIDRDDRAKPEILILLDALFFQFLHGYQKLFPASHLFWEYFEDYWQEYLEALAREKARHQDRIVPYSSEDFVWMGRKLSPIKICCTGMALLASREDEIPQLSQMIEHFHCGYQLLDDLQDCVEDLKHKDYTYPLTLACLRNQHKQDDIPITAEKAEELLWSQGIALEVLQKAIDFFSESLQDISHLSLPRLKTWIRTMQQDTRLPIKGMRMPRKRKLRIPQLKVFSQNDHHVAFNVSSSLLCEIDQEAASVLNQVIQGSWQGNGLKANEIMEQLQTASMFSSSPPPKKELNPPLTSLDLSITSQCNLRCLYCYGRGSDYGGEGNRMSREVGERAVDLILRESRDRPIVNIIFYGGEPLLNSELLTHLVYYSRQRASSKGKEVRFTLFTNGTILNPEIINLLSRENVFIQISLDGPPHIQNHQRPTIRGENTHAQVIENIRELQRNGVKQIALHATLFSLTPSPLEILDYLSSLGVRSISADYASPTQHHRRIWSENDVATIKKHQEELAEYFLQCLHEGKLIPYMNHVKPLMHLYRRKRLLYHCGAGTTMISVTPEGSIFPCSRFSEDPAFSVGDVFSGLNRSSLRTYVDCTVDKRESCRDCWARYLCGGSCFYDSLLASGDLAFPDPNECARKKHQFEVTIHLFASISRELPELVKRIEGKENLAFLMQEG